MSKDIFEKWQPVDNIPSRLYCEGLHDDYEGFRILLKGEDKNSIMLKITFEAPLAYQNVDEGNRLKTLNERSFSSSLYIVKKSSWCDWFVEESGGIHRSDQITHYAIYTADDCIDVLSKFEPVVEWL